MDTAAQIKRPAAELVITWSDSTETRYVRPNPDSGADSGKPAPSPETETEDFHVVTECAPYTASFNHLLSAHRPQENPLLFATLAYARMRTDGVPLNTLTYNLLMGRLVRFTDGSIFELYEQLKAEGVKESCSVQPNRETYSLLFRACERSAAYNRAFLLYQEMRELFDLTPDTPTYNTLMGFCAASKDVAQACYFVDEMKRNGVPMDSNTYNCYMSALVDTAPYAETLSIFDQMRDTAARPTLRTYNTVLRAMRTHGDFDRSFQVYEEMKKKGHIPDVTTYNTLLWACEDRLDYVLGTGQHSLILRTQDQKATGTVAVANLALTLLAEMEAVRVAPNTYSYNKVLSVLLRSEDARIFSVYRKVEHACQATAPLQRSPVNPPSLQPSLGSSGHNSPDHKSPARRRSGQLPPAASSPRTASNAATPSAASTPPRAAAVLPPAPAKRKPKQSLREAMCEEDPTEEGCMFGMGVRANLDTEKIIMRAFLLFGQLDKCKQLHLANRNLYEHFEITRDLAIVLLHVCDRTRDRVWAEALLQETVATLVRVDTEVFNAYLSVLATVADPALFDHFEAMKLGIHSLSVCATAETYSIIMRRHLAAKQYTEGLTVYTEMCDPFAPRPAALSPDDETLSLVIQLCEELHDADGATEAIERRIGKGQTLGVKVLHNLLGLYSRSKDPRIETLFASVKADCGRGGFPLVESGAYAIVMNYYLGEQRYDAVAQLFTELKTSQTLEPNPAVYRVIFTMYKQQGNRQALMAVFDDARMHRVKLDIDMYNSVLELFVDAKDPFVFEVLSDMRENCLPPTDTTLSLFLASVAGRQQLSEAMANHLFYKPTGNGYF